VLIYILKRGIDQSRAMHRSIISRGLACFKSLISPIFALQWFDMTHFPKLRDDKSLLRCIVCLVKVKTEAKRDTAERLRVTTS